MPFLWRHDQAIKNTSPPPQTPPPAPIVFDLIKQLSSCQRCLSSSHTLDSCFLSPSTPWLAHTCAGGQTSSSHNPSICPHKGQPASVENVNQVKTEQVEKMKSETLPINLVETASIRRHKNSADEKVQIVWDSCSDSHWVSKGFAEKLPQKTKKRVTLS